MTSVDLAKRLVAALESCCEIGAFIVPSDDYRSVLLSGHFDLEAVARRLLEEFQPK